MTLTVTVLAGRGLDIVRVGEHRDELRTRLGSCESFHRTLDAPLSDHFESQGLLLTYDSCGRLELIEAVPRAEVWIEEVLLLERSCPEVIADLDDLGITGVEHDAILEFRAHGFSLYATNLHDDDSELESVGVFTPDYCT
ncbi:hypothetical protein ACIBG0_40690 [Nocardia sp. NPDC050630]|uniref:hypothetical protein n=1 Tax=Nocardia sp. NPDC050630 TaxID=3364321 RepID=UPI00378FB097